jgi:hypothetical protein
VRVCGRTLDRFFFPRPSLPDFQRAMRERRKRNNVETLFGVNGIPSDNKIRMLLDGTEPKVMGETFGNNLRMETDLSKFYINWRVILRMILPIIHKKLFGEKSVYIDYKHKISTKNLVRKHEQRFSIYPSTMRPYNESYITAYEEPNKNSQKLFVLKDGDYLNTLQLVSIKKFSTNRSSNWVKIKDENNRIGWVFGGYTTVERGGPKYRTPKTKLDLILICHNDKIIKMVYGQTAHSGSVYAHQLCW